MMYSYHKNSLMASPAVHVLLALLILTQQTWCLPPTSLSSSEESNRGLLKRWYHEEHNSVFSSSQGPPPKCYLKYFLHQSPPQGLLIDHPGAEVYICQSLPDNPDSYFFATLFDDKAGIAILSAYTVNYEQARHMGKFPRGNVSNIWRTNPELTNQGNEKMYHGHGIGKEGFDKGHLNPAHINSFDKQHESATFTYSNAVPQYRHFNRGPWKSFESKIANYVTEQCPGKNRSSAVMYLMTGSSKFRLKVGARKPTQDKGQVKIHYFPGPSSNGSIVRPNSMWTAGCCVWKNENGIERAQSIAVMGNNDFTNKKIGIRSMKLVELEKMLVYEGTEPVAIFPAVKECRMNSLSLED